MLPFCYGTRAIRAIIRAPRSGPEEWIRPPLPSEATSGSIRTGGSSATSARKTRVQHRSQAKRACGLVLNERPQLPRGERERLEAILHNCARHGPSTQNREGVADFRAHLRGRLEHALQFCGGDRLRRWFDAIDWSR